MLSADRRDRWSGKPPWEPRCRTVPVVVRPYRIDASGRTGPTPGQARGRSWRRVAPGWYVPVHADRGIPEQRIVEEAARLDGRGAVTAWAALRLHRAAYFDGLDAGGRPVPVPLAVFGNNRLADAPSILLSREVLLRSETVNRLDVPCTRPERAVFDEARRLGDLRAAVVAVDMTLAAELTSLARLRNDVALRQGWRHVELVRQALALADENSRSPAESRLRLVWQLDAGRPRPLVNRSLFDPCGRLLGIADLLDPEAGVAAEYDGSEHGRLPRRTRDNRKDTAFRSAGLETLRVTADDMRDRGMLLERIEKTYAMARHNRRPQNWTLQPPAWFDLGLSLDERLALQELLQENEETAG